MNQPADVPIPSTMEDSGLQAWVLARLINGYPVDGSLERLEQPWQELAGAILACPDHPMHRAAAFEAALSGRQDAAAIRAAVFAADPSADLADLLPKKTLPASVAEAPDLPEPARLDPALAEGACLWLDLYIEYARKIAPMTPVIFHESAGLWLACVAIARRLVLPMAFTDIYPNLFILWVAYTTLYHKTTSLNLARSVALDAFPHLLAPQDTTPEAFLADMAGYQPANYMSMSNIEQQAWTKERNFAGQRGWVLDEVSGLMAGAGKDYNAGLIEALLRFYDCEASFVRSTRLQGRVVVRNSYLALLGASTPMAMMAHMTSERLWAMGWWPRFAILTPREQRPEWQVAIETARPPRLAQELGRLYRRLPEPQYPNFPDPVAVRLGQGVHAAWNEYNKALRHTLLAPDFEEQLMGSYGRLPTLVLKIAIILAALDWEEGRSCVIELRHYARAQLIAEAWRDSIHRAKALANQSSYERMRLRIMRQLARHPSGATFRELYRSLQDRSPLQIEHLLEEMILAGDIDELASEKGKRGRPSWRYKIIAG